jgi:zinc D-Ala-D-Ala carboxypeptidase
MASTEPAGSAARRPRSTGLAAFVFAGVALTGVVAGQLAGSPLASSSLRRGVSVFDSNSPAVANLDPDLLRALRRAAKDAARHGVEIVVNSGWRSPDAQERLLRQAVSKYGSERAAARWVATADASSHVSGDAVDIGPARATAWLSRHGARYRLCQVYRNEPWHYELRPGATAGGCPSMYADPRHDPRMHP